MICLRRLKYYYFLTLIKHFNYNIFFILIYVSYFFQAIFPLYDLKTCFNTKKFLDVLTFEIENLKTYPYWDSNDKKTLNNVVSKFAATCNPKRSKYWFTYYMK